jgi:hypothetical protein
MRTLVAVLVSLFGGTPPATQQLEARLERQMKAWQKRLGLEEWKIALHVVRLSEIDKRTWGNAEWDAAAKTGTINVLDPRDYNLKGSDLRLDMECTIVHELVHIQVAPLEAPDENAREDIVNRIMTALLNRPCPN